MIPVIMAGGSGTRLWPMSRTSFPKQFLNLNGVDTMLQSTVSRLDGLPVDDPIVICNTEHRFLVAEQLRQVQKKASIILEPIGRNTAPAIALAALHALRNNKDHNPVLLILAADHIINDGDSFRTAVKKLLPEVESGKFGTLGIVPTEAATGYGYIKANTTSTDKLSDVERFIEKPDLKTAQEYLKEGGYFWNSGIFMVRADRYLEALKEYRKDIYNICQLAIETTTTDCDFIRVNEEVFSKCADQSIDYAIMEPLSQISGDSQIVVSPLIAGWNDIGSWSALWEIGNKDNDGNVIMTSKSTSKNDIIMKNSQNCLISANHKLVATIGIKDLVIVDTPDAILVADRSMVQDVKSIVSELKKRERTEHYSHREVYRPWGKYDSIDNGERYQVKRITVNPGAKLSLQMHHHRAEHWIVVSGTAKVTNGEKTFIVTENQSTYIPIGQIHSLENPGVIPLEMIEVQSGSYLGEDDIVRLKDQYGRT